MILCDSWGSNIRKITFIIQHNNSYIISFDYLDMNIYRWIYRTHSIISWLGFDQTDIQFRIFLSWLRIILDSRGGQIMSGSRRAESEIASDSHFNWGSPLQFLCSLAHPVSSVFHPCAPFSDLQSLNVHFSEKKSSFNSWTMLSFFFPLCPFPNQFHWGIRISGTESIYGSTRTLLLRSLHSNSYPNNRRLPMFGGERLVGMNGKSD